MSAERSLGLAVQSPGTEGAAASWRAVYVSAGCERGVGEPVHSLAVMGIGVE